MTKRVFNLSMVFLLVLALGFSSCVTHKKYKNMKWKKKKGDCGCKVWDRCNYEQSTAILWNQKAKHY